mgnify:CR=1 FL=1
MPSCSPTGSGTTPLSESVDRDHPQLDVPIFGAPGLQVSPQAILPVGVGTAEGRSRAYINGTPVTQALLRELGALLVENRP